MRVQSECPIGVIQILKVVSRALNKDHAKQTVHQRMVFRIQISVLDCQR
jgi:hypothetical protein